MKEARELSHILAAMTDAAKEAGEEARRYRSARQDLKMVQKSSGAWDIVTEADRLSQSLIIERLAAQFPEASFVAEESGERAFSDFFFTIDPIDGTYNYANGGTSWSVILGCICKGRPVAGVIVQPETNTLLRAAGTIGCWLNEKPVSFNQGNDRRIVLSSGPWLEREETLLKKIVPALLSHGFQIIGAPCASECCLTVFSGRAELFLGHGEKIWDIAAAGAAMPGSNGSVLRLDGNEPRWDSVVHPVLLASSESLSQEVAQLIRPWYP